MTKKDEPDRTRLAEDDILWLDGDSFEVERLLTPPWKPLALVPKLSKRFDLVDEALKRLLVERGVSYLWQVARLTEAVLPPGPEMRPVLLRVLTAMLDRLQATTILTIVDPYCLLIRHRNRSTILFP
ncbi:MAG: hypothetical protein R2712_09295 [Vicinamibacterales bacterium]